MDTYVYMGIYMWKKHTGSYCVLLGEEGDIEAGMGGGSEEETLTKQKKDKCTHTHTLLINNDIYEDVCIFMKSEYVHPHTNEILKVHLLNFIISNLCTTKEEPQSKNINSQIRYSMVTVQGSLDYK